MYISNFSFFNFPHECIAVVNDARMNLNQYSSSILTIGNTGPKDMKIYVNIHEDMDCGASCRQTFHEVLVKYFIDIFYYS